MLAATAIEALCALTSADLRANPDAPKEVRQEALYQLEIVALCLARRGVLDEMIDAVHDIAKANGVSARGNLQDVTDLMFLAAEKEFAKQQAQMKADAKHNAKLALTN